MKKNYVSLLLLLLSAFCVEMHAQSFTQNWKKAANGTDYTWFGADNNTTSLAYNPATDKLLVAKRASQIYVINPNTGAQEDSLSLGGTALGTEGLKYNKIRVTNDGVIYAISLQTAAGTARIYRWASQRDTPTLAATFWVTERAGDAFGLSGMGVNTVLYASGAGTVNNAFSIYILTTTNGTTFTRESKVTMTSAPTTNQQWANRVIEPEATGVNSPLWIKGGGFNARKITVGAKTDSLRVGTVVATVPDGTTAGEASIGYGGMRMLTTAGGIKFLCFGGGNNAYAGTKLTAITVAQDTVFRLFGRDSLAATTAYVANANGTGDISFKVNANGTFTTFYLSTNNGIAATTSRVFTNVKEVEAANFTVKVLGNPINETLHLQVDSKFARPVSVTIYGALGNILTTQKSQLTEGVNTLHFAAHQLPSGLLFVEVNDGVSKQIVKVIK